MRRVGGLLLAATLTAGCGASSHVKAHVAAPSSTSSSTATTSTSETTSTTVPAATSTVPRATWRSIPAAPGSADGAPVWTGDEFVVWGGGGQGHPVAEGVAYRPATRTWRRVAPAPLSARSSHTAVWTGKEILYWGGLSGSNTALADGAAYDPAADTWRPLPGAPIPGHFGHEAVWTGREMVVWGGTTQCCPVDSTIHDVEAVAYDPAANRWRRLADVPSPWSGDDGPAITGSVAGNVLVWRNGHLGRLDVTANRWTDLGSPPAPPPPASGVSCHTTNGDLSVGAYTSDHFFVWTGGCKAEDGAAFDLQKSAWTTIGSAPTAGLSDVVVTPDVFGVTTDPSPGLARYDQQRKTWQVLSAPPKSSLGSLPVALWTGVDVLLWGGYGDHTVRTGALYRP